MKIEIKNVKHSDFASEETNCFEATIYLDGKRVLGVSNDGKGGCDNYFSVDSKKHNEIWSMVAEINKELGKEFVKMEDGIEFQNDLEIEVGHLFDKWLLEKEAKKVLRKIAYVGKGGAVYTLPAKIKPTTKNLELVQKAKWWKDSYVLLNGMQLGKVAELI